LVQNSRTWVGHLAGFLVIFASLVIGPAALADKIKHPVAVFSGLDKITGRTIAFEAAAGETVQFGSLQITERACYTRPATEAPQTVSFVEVDEVDAEKKYKRIFSGWMFAASPGLHGIEHPIYDIWLTDCTGSYGQSEASPEVGSSEEVPPVAPDDPLRPIQEPAKPKANVHPSKARAPAAEPPMDEAPQDQQTAEPPPMGGPIEVGPPPGFSPAPQGRQRPLVPQD